LIGSQREFKRFESVKMASLEEFMANPISEESLFSAKQLSDRRLMERLRDVSALMIRRLVPQNDQSSPCLRAIVKELFATSTLWPVIVKMSLPNTLFYIIATCMPDESAGMSHQPGTGTLFHFSFAIIMFQDCLRTRWRRQ
jgi:hypothetical protein